MPRWFLLLSALAGLNFAVPAGHAALTGDLRLLVIGVILTGFCWWPLITWLRYRNATTDSDIDSATDGTAPENLRARGQRRWIAPVLLLLLVAVLGLVHHPFDSPTPLWALTLAAVTIWQMRSGGDQIDFTDEALVVRLRNGREKRHRWSDVLELSWSSPHWANTGSGPVARVRGSAFDSPGPTSPAQLGAVLLAGHDNRLWGRQQVRRAAAAHGIPYTDDLITAINSGRRKARLPGEAS